MWLLTLLALAADDEDKATPWSVDSPPGTSKTVDIDTREGTWMSLDVHPDGDRIVFDLLGDLYEIPIAGGEARSLTSGMSWDMQPLYTPDGKGLIFTSDRGGGDNLWEMAVGEEPRAITEESFRLLNSPSVQGDYVLGRKHFTGSRSLGAGEIWIYHRTGGTGLQLTEKQNDQKDVGEPAFSPDGRYVYWSRDATPGDFFEYNKDSNSGIYIIERLDRQTGRTERVVGGPGGAIRPTPHPDGVQLAYVRRVRDKTVLMVRNLKTGEDVRLFDGLDRDMQETWAIHGVYPRFDWTPDGRFIVIWAQGGLWKIDSTGAMKPQRIAFHVADTREVRPPLRRKVDVAPESFDVRMVKGTVVHPEGDSVVFEVLGRLWIRDLPKGEPRQLTRDEDVREVDARWSRDGRKIVFISWTDSGLGVVKTVNPKNGKTTAVTAERGHYREPDFTPDGRSVVYRKARGGWLISDLHGTETGLYIHDLKSGERERLTRSGQLPHFGSDPDVLYFTEGYEPHTLKQLRIGDRTVQTLASSEGATDFRVSPDGRWIAWQEDHNVHVRPRVPTGDSVTVSVGGKDVPTATVSKDAGNHLHFSGDGETLIWSLGPTLHTARLETAFDEEPPEPTDIDLSFTRDLDRPTATVAIRGARLVTMNGDEVIESGTIVWKGDRILAVGPDVDIPGGTKIIDGKGLTVIPGLVDVHAHGSQGSGGLVPQQNWKMLGTLAYGVTTIHDPSNSTEEVFTASELQRTGGLLAPRIFSTGSILYGAKIPGLTAKINDLDDALGHLRRMKAVGAFSVKSYNQPRREQRQQVLEAARQLDMMVVPEGGSLLQHNLTMVVDGHTTVEHCIPVRDAYSDVLQLWGGNQVGYTPTLGVAYGGLSGEEYWYAKTSVWEDERLLNFVPRSVVDPRSRRRELAPDEDYNHIGAASVAKKLLDQGVWVNLGAHGQREGLAAHWEMWMFEQGGMTPHEALRSATLLPAKTFGFDEDIGSIEVGKLADFAVLSSNPLEDLRQSTDVKWTILGGRIHDAMTMNPVFPEGPDREPLWFEQRPTNTP